MSENGVEKRVLLLVDDRPENLDLLISFLEKYDFNIMVAKSGDEVLKRLEHSSPDIILLDIMMPGIDGFETCRWLKKSDKNRNIPVIFMSALDDVVDKVKGLELGAVDYISKPFVHEEVLARITNHLQIQDLKNELESANRMLEKRVEERTVELKLANQKLIKEIAERKQIEQDLKLFRELINQSNDALFVSDVETSKILDVNNLACENLGYTRDELLQKTIIDVETIVPDKDAWDKIMQEIYKKGPLIMEGEQKRKDGSLFPVEVSGRNIQMNGKKFNVSFIRNITDRKQAEKKLKESEKGLKEAELLAHLGHWKLDLITGKLYWSDEVYRIFEVNPMEFDNTYESFLALIHPDDMEMVDRVYKKSLEEKTNYETVHRILFKNKSIKYVNEKGVTHYNDKGEAICSIGTVHDITELKLAQLELEKHRDHLEVLVYGRTKELADANKKLKELDHLKSMFIASMSHELRTPLNSIIGFSGMTLMGLSGEINDEQKDNIQRVYKSSKHLLELINDVIDISKIEAGIINTYCELFSLCDVVDEAIGNVSYLLKEKEIVIKSNVTEDIEMNSDRKRVLQCLVNILSNAVKYTEAGKVTISAEIFGESIELSVTDTGIGILENDIPRLFEPFERLQSTLTIKAGGTGLGLYLTKKIVRELLQGSVEVESKDGEGSKFTLKMPRELILKKNDG